MNSVGMTRDGWLIEVDSIGQLQKMVQDNGNRYEVELSETEEIHFLQDEIRASRRRLQDSLEDVVSRYDFRWLTPNKIFQVASNLN
jgi:hypothetical protein